MRRSEIARLWARIAADYPQAKPFPPIAIDSWIEDLGEYPLETVAAAYKHHRQSDRGGFPPTSGLLRAIVLEFLQPIPSFAQVWDELKRHVSAYGYMRGEEALASLSGTPGAAELVAVMGGWYQFCVGGTDELHPVNAGVWRSQAEHAWGDLAADMRRRRESPQLPSPVRDALPEASE